jgi:hypothetical protein
LNSVLPLVSTKRSLSGNLLSVKQQSVSTYDKAIATLGSALSRV